MDLKTIFTSLALAAALLAPATSQGQDYYDEPQVDFMDSGSATRLFTLGARLGINTSVTTLGTHSFNDHYNRSSWGTGFTAGVVANLNFRDWLSLQPGCFWDCRSGDYTLISTENVCRVSHSRLYDLTIPVMVSTHFNVTPRLRWTAEAGPYLMVRLSKGDPINWTEDGLDYHTQRKGTDWGVKMGMGLTLNCRYSIYVHYLAGCNTAWTNFVGGHNKQWAFTLGYEF